MPAHLACAEKQPARRRNVGSLFPDRLSKLQTAEELFSEGGSDTNDDSGKSKLKNKYRQVCG